MNNSQYIQKEAPLLPQYPFKEYLLAGETPISANNRYDWWIDRPQGMEGWIINITMDGMGQVWRDNNRFLVQTGDVLIFPANIPHLYGRYEQASTWTHRWIFFHPPSHWNNLLKFVQSIKGVQKTSISQQYIFNKISSLFKEMIYLSYVSQKDIFDEQLALNILEEILLRCAKADSQKKENTNLKDPTEKIVQVMEWVAVNYTQILTVNIIAKIVEIPSHQLTVQFKEYMGIPLMRWINNQRLEFAVKLLSISKLPIKEVANQVGFTDSLYFSRLFKRYYSSSPREYRNKILNQK